MNKSQAYYNYFKLKKLVTKLGNQSCSLDEANAYNKLVQLLQTYGRLLIKEYPNLDNIARIIGFDKISKKMVRSYKS